MLKYLFLFFISINVYAYETQNKPRISDKAVSETTPDSKTIPKGKFLMGITGEMVANPLVQVSKTGEEKKLISSLMEVATFGRFGLFSFLELGYYIPYASPSLGENIYSKTEVGGGLGDISLDTKLSFTKNFSLYGQFSIPTGSAESFRGSSAGSYEGRILYSLFRESKVPLYTSVGTRMSPGTVYGTSLSKEMEIIYTVATNYYMNKNIDLNVEMFGSNTSTHSSLQTLLGMTYRTRTFDIRAGGGMPIMGNGDNFRIFTTINFNFPKEKNQTGIDKSKLPPIDSYRRIDYRQKRREISPKEKTDNPSSKKNAKPLSPEEYEIKILKEKKYQLEKESLKELEFLNEIN